jgi:replicative DNA helicase
MERRGRMRSVETGAEAARVPPHDLDAERAVIGAMLVSETAVAAVAERLAAEDFYSEVHRIIYGAMMRLYSRGEPIDQLTLTNELRSVNEFERIGGRPYVFQIVESVPTAANAGRYADIVRGKALLRAIIDVGSRITEDAFREPEDVSEALDSAEQLVYGVSNRTLREHLAPVSELAPGALEMIQRLYEQEGEVTGVETGFEDLDRLTTGFHNSDLIILAARPAMGKCLKWDSSVIDPNSGERLTIEECVERRLPRVLNVSSAGNVRTTAVSDWIDSGVKPCYRVTTRSGRSVEVTGHHPFLTVDGWVPLHDLEVGNHVAVPRRVPIFGSEESWQLDRVRLAAYFIAEGGLTGGCPKWSNADPALVEDFRGAIGRQFPEVQVIQDGSRGYDYKLVRSDRCGGFNSNPVTAWLRELGLMGKYAEEKSFPDCVWRWSRRYLAEFLRVLFSCDATIYRLGSYPRIEFTVSSERLARDVHHALTRFGVVAKLRKKKERCWRVEITAPDSMSLYQAEIGWIGEKTLRFMDEAFTRRELPRRGSNYGHPPREVWDMVRRVAAQRSLSLSELARRSGETAKMGKHAGYNPHTGRSLPAYRLRSYAEVLADQRLLQVSSQDLLWDEIVYIESIGDHQVYDLTVPDGSNFIAQDICVHNTALSLNAIWHAASEKKMPVAIFSLEMSKEQLVQRLISQTTRIPTQALRSGNVKAEDWPKLVRGVAEVSRAPIWIDDTAGVTLMEIRAKVRRLASQLNVAGEMPLSLVVVDYLQLMVGSEARNRAENRQQEVSEISRGLKVLARDLDVPVLAVAQLSRAVESRHDKRPLLSDLRDSGCIPASARISRADNGGEVTLGELVLSQQTPYVWSVDDRHRLVPAKLIKAFPTGIKPVYRMKLASGLSIEATANHPFLTIEGWARLDSLSPDGFVAVPRILPSPIEQGPGWKDDELVLLAHLLGDGSIGPNGVKYATADPANKKAVEEASKTLFGIEALTKTNGNTYQVWLPSPYRLTHGKKHPVREWLEPHGLWGARSWNKFVPEEVFGLEDQKLALFLRHLWATDGSITISRNGHGQTVSTYYGSTSRRLVLDVKRMLLRFGIRSAFGKTTKKRGGGVGSYRASYNLRIQGAEDQRRFLSLVGCYGERGEKIAPALEILSVLKANPNVDLVPWEVRPKVAAAMAEKGVNGRELAEAIGETYNGGYLLGTPERRRRFSRTRLARMAGVLESEELANIAQSDLFWDRIVEITPLGEQPTFDVTVEGTHNFIADGVVVHNSIEQDADMVMFLYRDEYYNSESDDKGIAEVIVGKHRNGPTGKVQLAWMEQYTKFASLARR